MFIPEITTRVTVEVDTSAIDDALNVINSSELLSDIPSLTDTLETAKNKLTDSKIPLGQAVSKRLQSNQENIISSKHYITGAMANSVDIMGDGADFLVGNTASSVDGFPYPLAIEEGTSPHWVEPVTFSALHWEDKFSKGHMVSGIKADPFVQPSIDNTIDDIDDIINDVLGDLI